MNSRSDNPPIPSVASSHASDAIAPVVAPRDAPANFKSWLVPLVLLMVVQFGAPFVPVTSAIGALVSITLLTLLYVGSVVGFSLGAARQQWSLPILIGGFVGCGLAWGATLLFARSLPFGYAFQNFALVGLGTFFGLLVSKLIKHANMIGPIGVLVALIDIWGVLFNGIVAQLLTNKATQTIATKAMGSGPKLGAATSKFHLELPDVGIGDYLFLALFLGAIVHFGMNWRASAIWMWAGVSVALLAITLQLPIPVPTSLVPFSYHWLPTVALPGLLFLGAGAVLPNLKYFQFTREEKFALLYAGIFVAVLTIALYFGLTSMIPKN